MAPNQSKTLINLTPTPIFQISEFVELLNQHLSRLGEIILEGEISRFDIKNQRLIFGSIKDATSTIDFFSLTHQLPSYHQFEPGMLVHLYGTAGLYKGSGKFRFFVNQIVPKGEGSLQIAYEKLKQQLAAEGLFAPERKRPLPPWPKKIGLITAPNSAAQADLLKVITARLGGLTLSTLPVSVQGREAIPTILRAFAYLTNHPQNFDLVIIARGGGSLEDLAAFNSEEVCRAVFACPIPVISAIGHENDWSLTDYVADLRASTPSNAAELAVKNRSEVLATLSQQSRTLHQTLHFKLRHLRHQLDLSQNQIHHRLQATTKTVSALIDRVPTLVVNTHHLLSQQQQALDLILPNLYHRLTVKLQWHQQTVAQLARLIASLHPQHLFRLGYSLTRLTNGTIIKSASQVKTGNTLVTQLHQGKVRSTVVYTH